MRAHLYLLATFSLLPTPRAAAQNNNEQQANNEQTNNSSNQGEEVNNTAADEEPEQQAQQSQQLNAGFQADNNKKGEGVNNAPTDDFLPAQAAPANNAVVSQGALDTTVNPVVDTAAPAESQILPANGTLPGNFVLSQANAAAPAVDTSVVVAPPQVTGVVRYVRSEKIPVYVQPGGATASVSLAQGDHPLVAEEGAWARMQDGHYISTSELSIQGIGRRRHPTVWR